MSAFLSASPVLAVTWDLPTVIWWATIGLLVVFSILNIIQALLVFFAGQELNQFLRQQPADQSQYILQSNYSPRISLLAPAFNEELMITDTVTAMLTIEYSNLEVVVINDGSDDATLERLIEHFDLRPSTKLNRGPLATMPIRAVYKSPIYPRLVVIDKENGGKADALNAGLVRASGDLVCSVDADTLIEPDAMERLALLFVQDPDLLAAGGCVRPLNGCRVEHGRVLERAFPNRFLAGVQAVEYSRAFLFGRLGWNRLGGNIIVSGAFGLFDRESVITVGGYVNETVGEDMELVLRLRRDAIKSKRPAGVSFIPDPVAWTEVPENVRALARQRNRWQRGLLSALWLHRRAIANPRYGLMGLVVMPYYVLELIAPVLEAIGLILLGWFLYSGQGSMGLMILLLVMLYGVPTVLSSISLSYQSLLDGHRLASKSHRGRLRWLLLEQIGFRQLTVAWRLWGLVASLRGDRRWGTQVRHGVRATS